ncbi:MAG: molybdenum cofactor cytidylyltransferase [Verrucomicrobiota bacterium]|jgi:molybdenum cofactor cytidylyltransferase
MRSIGAVVLAAGASSRLGRPKQLLNFRGETLVRRAVRAATEAHCDPVIVVVGHGGEAIRDELRATSALVVENAEWQRGLRTSIRCGLRQFADSMEAVVLLTCDQPFVDAAIVAGLIAVHEKTCKPIIASSYADALGVPALFDRSCFDALRALPDNCGAKSLIAARSGDVAAIPFEQGAIDIDTPSDFQRLIAESE